MTTKTPRLTWTAKDDRPTLERFQLVESPALSYRARKNITGHAIFDNKIIYGDNLSALYALAPEFSGRIKCVFIDPPYNTGQVFNHYADRLESSEWLSFMRDRLEIIKELLSDDGALWITIDDNEAHYLKVVCDEIFGRPNFVANVIWQKKHSPLNHARWLSADHDHVLLFAKNKKRWRPNLLPRSEAANARYKNPDNDPRGPWAASDLSAHSKKPAGSYSIVAPSGRVVNPPVNRSWGVSQEKFKQLVADNRVWFGASGDNAPRRKKFIREVKQGITPKTIWTHPEVGHTSDAKKEVIAFNHKNVFATPKPEKLLMRILHLSTNTGDLVLDAFAGSGTTGAVAHKMGRRWIMMEMGEHCHTHMLPRLKKVIEGEDPGGISKTVNWQGGGGFQFYQLTPQREAATV
jgi:adenine-specific DNA-methyltransferase